MNAFIADARRHLSTDFNAGQKTPPMKNASMGTSW